MDYILRKFKYKQKPQTTPKMVITSPKPTVDESCDSMKFDFELEEHSPLPIPHTYSNRYELDSDKTQESNDRHNSLIKGNHFRHQSHHSSHYSLNSTPSRSSGSSDGPEHQHFDSNAITKLLLNRPVIVRRNEEAIHLNDNSFAVDCLYWHNLFRAKHGSPPLTLSYSLINMAQEWANYLAHTDSYKYRNTEGIGENLMSKWTCHPEFDPPGETIVRFWYSELSLYNYEIDPSIMHTLANHFTQVVWKSTEEFGIGKAHTRGGKLIVVANYRPAAIGRLSSGSQIKSFNKMSVVILLTGRIWTSVSATELNDNCGNDGLLAGPTYIARDQVGIPPEESQLYKFLNARMVKEKVWTTQYPPATIIAKLLSCGYKLICQAGSGVGFSGKARYSADVAVTDYRWSWTLVKESLAPPAYSDNRYTME